MADKVSESVQVGSLDDSKDLAAVRALTRDAGPGKSRKDAESAPEDSALNARQDGSLPSEETFVPRLNQKLLRRQRVIQEPDQKEHERNQSDELQHRVADDVARLQAKDA